MHCYGYRGLDFTLGHEQEARWLWTSHIAVGAQVPAEHADVHLNCWHILDGPQS